MSTFSFRYLISFGEDYEGESVKYSRMFDELSEIKEIIELTEEEYGSFDYWIVQEVKEDGRLERIEHGEF